MAVTIIRGKDELSIYPNNIVCINKSAVVGSEYKYACVMTSGDTIHITEEEMEMVSNAFADTTAQLNKLIDNTNSIITELQSLNATSDKIEVNTGETNTNIIGMTGSIDSMKGSMDSMKGSVDRMEVASNNIKISVDKMELATKELNESTKIGNTLLADIKKVCKEIIKWVKE